MMSDDVDLLTRVADGDEDAFTQLYRRHCEAVAAFATLRGTHPSEVGEVTSRVWVTCWTSAASFRGDSTVKTWLLGITGRTVASFRREMSRKRRREILVHDVPDTSSPDEPTRAVLRASQRDQVVDAVRGLPPHLYTTVVLAWVEELPYAEISCLQQIPVGTVKSRISTARSLLAPVLSACNEDGT